MIYIFGFEFFSLQLFDWKGYLTNIYNLIFVYVHTFCIVNWIYTIIN